MMSVALDTSMLIGVLAVRGVWHPAALYLHDVLIAAQLPWYISIVPWPKPAALWPGAYGSNGGCRSSQHSLIASWWTSFRRCCPESSPISHAYMEKFTTW